MTSTSARPHPSTSRRAHRRRAARTGRSGSSRCARLHGTAPHKGHELQIVSTPSGTDLFTAPAVWRSGEAHVADRRRRRRDAGLGAARRPAALGLAATARAERARSIAGGLLYVYDPNGGLNVYGPTTGKLVTTLSAGPGHWNSPIVDRRPRRAARGQRERPRHDAACSTSGAKRSAGGGPAALAGRAPRRRAPAATRSASRARD